MSFLSSLLGSSNRADQPPVDPEFYYKTSYSGYFRKVSLENGNSTLPRMSSVDSQRLRIGKKMIVELVVKTADLFRPPIGGITVEKYGPRSTILDHFQTTMWIFLRDYLLRGNSIS